VWRPRPWQSPVGSDYGNAPTNGDGGNDPYANVPSNAADDVRSANVTRYPNATGNPINITAGGMSYRIQLRDV
jgi:hypothetical protein